MIVTTGVKNVLIRKLEAFGTLPTDDMNFLDELIKTSRVINAHQDLIQEGDRPGNVQLIIEGFACRYKNLPNGSRQIVAYLLPGDFCDLYGFVLKSVDHSIATLSSCRLVAILPDQVIEMTRRPSLARALWWATLVDEATLREWIVNVGQRPAEQRVAHLLCELHFRLSAAGLTNGECFELPLRQNELADTTGMSLVHVNRSIQSLRAKNLITFKNNILNILNFDRLVEIAEFKPNYLHLVPGK